VELRTWGSAPMEMPKPPNWNYQELAEQARHDIGEIRPLLEEVLEPGLLTRVVAAISSPGLPVDDDLWVRIVYAFAAATRPKLSAVDQLASMFVPLYLWRAATFMARATLASDAIVQGRLESLSQTFEQLKPVLVDSWSAEL
jgi:hypothetical protein